MPSDNNERKGNNHASYDKIGIKNLKAKFLWLLLGA